MRVHDRAAARSGRRRQYSQHRREAQTGDAALGATAFSDLGIGGRGYFRWHGTGAKFAKFSAIWHQCIDYGFWT